MEDGEHNDGNGSSTDSEDQNVERPSPIPTPQNQSASTFEIETDSEKRCIRVPSETFCTKRTCGFLCLLICIVILTIVVLLIVWPKCPSPETDTVCRTPHCRSVSAKIIANLSISTDPCVDFWDFACGKWVASNPIPKSRGLWSTSLQAEHMVKEKIRDLLSTKEMEKNSVDLKVKHFYDSCMAVPEIGRSTNREIDNMILLLHGWEPLRSFTPEEFDFQQQLNNIHGEYGGSPFFRVDVLPDPDCPFSQNIIRIRPTKISLPHQFYQNPNDTMAIRYKTYVKDILLSMWATPNYSTSMTQVIFEFEGRLANAISRHVLHLNFTHPNNFGSWEKIKLKDLKSTADAVDWVDFLSSLFPETTITDDTSVLVTSINYLKLVSQIISTSDNKTLNTYMIWELVNNYVPYMSREFGATHERFHLSIRGSREPIPRWEFCVVEVMKIFSPIVSSWLSEESEGRDEKLKMARQITQDIHESFIDENTRRSSLDRPGFRRWAMNKVNWITYKVGTADLEKKNLTVLYESLDVHPKGFLQNMVLAKEFKHKQLQISLKNETKTFLQMFPENPFKIDFIPGQRQIIIPETVLQKKYLLTEYRSIPLGSLSVEIGEAIANILWFELGFSTEDENLLPFHHAPLYLLQRLSGHPWDLDCILGSASRKNGTLEEVTWTKTPHLSGVLHKVGFDIAMTAVKFLESTKTKQPHLPFLEGFDSLGLFFISYVQSQCSSTSKEFSNMEAFRLTGNERMKNIVQLSSVFGETFHCPQLTSNLGVCSPRSATSLEIIS